MKFVGKTDTGKKHNTNEDFFLLPDTLKNSTYSYNSKKGMLFVLCDGVGGHNAGEVASRLTATWIMEDFYDNTTQNPNLLDIIISVNRRVYNLSLKNSEYMGMATTLVAGLIKDDNIFIYSAGDSRCYRFRDNKLVQLTDDDSEVWNLYKMGEITKDEIRFHPQNNIITMAIGIYENPKINSYSYRIQKNDVYLICSDGLTDMVSDSNIEKILTANIDLSQKANLLIQTANKAGGKDNITVILIQI